MLSKNIFLLTLVGIVLSQTNYGPPLTFDDLAFCDVESANASSCLRDMIQNWTIILGTRGINHPICFNIEPMFMDHWNLNINLRFLNNTEHIWNVTFSELWNSTISAASYDPSNYSLIYTAFYPHFLEGGRYDMQGMISLEDGTIDELYGHGTYDKDLYGMNITHKITFVPVQREHGIEYMEIDRYELVSGGFRNMSLNWHNLYDGDTIRANRASNTLTHNAMAIGGALEGSFTEMLKNMFFRYTERLIGSVPRKQLRRHFFRNTFMDR